MLNSGLRDNLRRLTWFLSKDDKVPHAQSVEVVEALRERKQNGANELSFEYEEKEGLDHGYDYAESETMSEMWAWVVDKLDEK